MAMTLEEKRRRARERMLDKAEEYTPGTYCRKFVAPEFQKMVRAEAGSQPPGYTPAVVAGELAQVFRNLGQVVCVTCGKVGPWSGGTGRFGGMHTGHFIASRCNSILFELANVAPQCSHCNVFQGGAVPAFRIWMEHVRGPEEINRLHILKNTVVRFSREELVDMKISFTARFRAAIERMESTT
jgi:predicted butyrate kinase (DUF1464 family)